MARILFSCYHPSGITTIALERKTVNTAVFKQTNTLYALRASRADYLCEVFSV